jgi:hypothetical protein
MKRVFLFSTLFLLLLAVGSCSREVSQPSGKAVKGDWQWVYSAGGLTGSSVAPINNTLVTLSLNPDSTYTFYLNNEVQISGSYAIQSDNNSRRVLHLDHSVEINKLAMEPEQLIVVWDSGQLQLQDSHLSDGFNHHFKKVK